MRMVPVCFDLLSFQTCCDVVVVKDDDAETAPAFRLALVKHTNPTRRSTRPPPARLPTTAPIAAALT